MNEVLEIQTLQKKFDFKNILKTATKKYSKYLKLF